MIETTRVVLQFLGRDPKNTSCITEVPGTVIGFYIPHDDGRFVIRADDGRVFHVDLCEDDEDDESVGALNVYVCRLTYVPEIWMVDRRLMDMKRVGMRRLGKVDPITRMAAES